MSKQIEELYVKHSENQINMIKKIVKNHSEAEDIVHDGYAKAIEKLDQFDEEKGSIKTWVNAIIFNGLRNKKRELINIQNLKTILFIREFNNEDLVWIKEQINLIRNPKHKLIVELYYKYGYTTTEISELFETISVTNVTTICNRFKNVLKEIKINEKD